MTTPQLSIVVPTLNRRDSVLRLLRALHAQSAPPSTFEAIVVVDGSTDGTLDAVHAHTAPFALRAIDLPRSGRSRARNEGVRSAAGDLVLFLDDDMEPAPGLIAEHLARHDAPDVLGVVGAVPVVVPADAPPIVRYRAAVFARKLGRLATRSDQLAFGDVYSGNLSIRRARLLDAAGYDETFDVYGHEDYELALRLGRDDGRFVYSAAALANQYYDKTLRGLAADVHSEGRTSVLFARKHPEVLPSLTVGRFTNRSRRARLRLAATLLLDRLRPDLPSRLVASVERYERDATPADDAALFTRYDRLFDALYWIGAERTLREGGVPWWTLAVRDVPRWLGGPV
ncbi:MAG: glycosyltransferase family 2 protein [Gemmatimonadaceae bacterium]